MVVTHFDTYCTCEYLIYSPYCSVVPFPRFEQEHWRYEVHLAPSPSHPIHPIPPAFLGWTSDASIFTPLNTQRGFVQLTHSTPTERERGREREEIEAAGARSLVAGRRRGRSRFVSSLARVIDGSEWRRGRGRPNVLSGRGLI